MEGVRVTRVDKSPEQYDAEASRPLEERNLASAITLHRLMFRKDAGLPLQLHQRDGDDAGLGAAFNATFIAYLDGSTGHTDSWNSALLWMRERVCRKTHSKHWQPAAWGGALCYRLTSHVIRWDMTIPQAMARLGLTETKLTERTLDSALLAVENRLEWMLRGDPPDVERSPAEWMATAHVHHRVAGLHAQECEQCAVA